MRDVDDSKWMLGPARRFAGGGAFRQGFVSNVLNPKLVVFFISVLPAFTSDQGSFFAQVAVLGLAFEALTAIWLLSYGAGVARVGEAMRAPRVRHLLERISGTVLIALGLKVAVDGAGEL
jgi:threonine/homoserine/homoserine lactone efflux protein